MQKLTYALRRRPEMTREAFQQYWLERHAPLVRSHAATLGIRRYVQVHATPDAEEHPGRASRGSPPPYDGTAELWFDAALASGSDDDRRAAREALREDEARFIDHSQSPAWTGEEHVIIDRGGTGLRLTYLLRRLPERSFEDFQRYWLDHHAPLVRETVGPRVTRYVQVHALPESEAAAARRREGAPEPYDGVAELWIDDSLPATVAGQQPQPDVLHDDESKFIDFARSPLWMGQEHPIIEG